MSKKQTSSESFFGKVKRPNEEAEEEEEPTTSKKKERCVYSNRQYMASYLKYGFTATGDSHAPALHNMWRQANEAMKPSKLLR